MANNKTSAANLTLVAFNTKFSELNISTERELSEQNFKGITIEKKNGDKYYFLYTGEKQISQFGWNEVIDTGNAELLQYANELRKKYVDTLRKLITTYLASSCPTSASANIACQVSAVGSTSPTSNYDVTVTSFLVATIIVENFNKYFFEFWNDTSGKVFDTNFYGNSFFINIYSSINYNKKLDSLYNTIDTGRQRLFYLPPENLDEAIQDLINQQQLRWLILKIYLYRDEFSIVNNNGLLNTSLTKIEELILNYMLQKYSNKKENNQKSLKEKFIELNSQKPAANSSNPNEYRKKLDQLYVSKLRIIDKNHQDYQLSNINTNLNKRNELLKELIDSISLCNFFGSETYFCMGTIYHVVGHIQGLGNFVMSSEYYVQSMLENLIDVFRYSQKIGNDNFKFVLKASKYIFRIYDAIQKYLEITKNGNESSPSEETKKNNTTSNLKVANKKNLFNNIRNFYKKHTNSHNFQLNTNKQIESRIAKLFMSYNNIDSLLSMIISDISSTILA